MFQASTHVAQIMMKVRSASSAVCTPSLFSACARTMPAKPLVSSVTTRLRISAKKAKKKEKRSRLAPAVEATGTLIAGRGQRELRSTGSPAGRREGHRAGLHTLWSAAPPELAKEGVAPLKPGLRPCRYPDVSGYG